MATIRSVLQLQDSFSSPLRKISDALNMTVSAFQRMQEVSDKAVDIASFDAIRSKIASANVELEEMSSKMKQVSSKTNSAKNSQDNYTKAIYQSNEALDKLVSKAKLLFDVSKIAFLTKQVIDASDSYAQTSARLQNVLDGTKELSELQEMVYASAERSRSSYTETARIVARVGSNAKNSFKTNEEMVAFAEQLNKRYVIAGATIEEQRASLIQLSQALGSGVLRGEELNSVFEAAPNIIQSIADYLDVPIGSIREMAAEGQITTDIIKNAIFSTADEINEKFEAMPMTWEQVWVSMKNYILRASAPILEAITSIWKSDALNTFKENTIATIQSIFGVLANLINQMIELFNNPAFMSSINVLLIGLTMVAEVMGWIAGVAISAFTLIVEYSSFILPIILGIVGAYGAYYTILGLVKGAQFAYLAVQKSSTTMSFLENTLLAIKAWGIQSVTKALAIQIGMQMGLNGALGLTVGLISIFLIAIIAIVAIIYAAVAAWNALTGSTVSALGIIMGSVYTAGAFIYNLFYGVAEFILKAVESLWNRFATFANFLANIFVNPISSVIYLFQGLADGVLAILEGIASAIDAVFGSNLAGAVGGWRDSLKSKADELVAKLAPEESYKEVVDKVDFSLENFGLKRMEYGDAWDKGYNLGENWESKLKNSFTDFNPDMIYGADPLDGVLTNLDNISNNTDKISDSVDYSEEDLRYLRDIAEREIINRFTTAEINIDMTNNNNINSKMDLDGVVSYLEEKLYEGMVVASEGV